LKTIKLLKSIKDDNIEDEEEPFDSPGSTDDIEDEIEILVTVNQVMLKHHWMI
jgi:hypothetical protein